MKLGKISLSVTSLVLLVIQLAIVSTIAGKYLYQRWSCPRVWTRTVAYDPQLPMRGRYLSLQLMVDGCQSTLPSAKQAAMPRNVNGVPTGKTYSIPCGATGSVSRAAQGGRRQAAGDPDSGGRTGRPDGQMVMRGRDRRARICVWSAGGLLHCGACGQPVAAQGGAGALD